MKKLTRKTVLIFSLYILMVAPSFAMVYDEVVENTCSMTFNFFGIVKKWKGHKLVKSEDEYGRTVITEIGCGEGGGSWDWFWE